MSTPKERIVYIDAIKGVGILLVVLAHHIQEATAFRWWVNSFHMPLFFIVTGFLNASTPNEKTSNVLLRRTANALLYPYVTFSLILIAWHIVFYSVLGAQPEVALPVVAIQTLSTYGYHALWFLPAMFWARLIYGAIPQRRESISYAIILIAGCFVSWLSDAAITGETIFRYIAIYIGRILVATTFIKLGSLFSRVQKHAETKRKMLICITAGVISIVFYKLNPEPSLALSRISNPIYYYLLACSGSVFIILFCEILQNTRLNVILATIGQNSLILMALHMDISIEVAWMIVGKLRINQWLSFRNASIVAVLLELVILNLLCAGINRFAPFLLKPKRLDN